MQLSRRTIKRARIEIIPMIDTIFFLLVFFMISTLGRGHDVRLQVHHMGNPRLSPFSSVQHSLDHGGSNTR